MPASQQEFPQRDVIVVGGGYGALSAALALHRIGLSTLVLEKSSAARQEGFSIGAWSNAWRALEELGVADEVRKGHLAQTKFQFADMDQNVFKELRIQDLPPPEGMKLNELRVIRRMAVPSAISAALPKNTIHYGCKIVGATVTPTGAEVELEGGQKLSAKLVILGDGVHSKTANKYHKMALKTVDIAAWRAIVEVDCEEEGAPAATVSNGPNVRAGTIPVSFDPERKKMLWYYFVAAAMPAADLGRYNTPEKHKEAMLGFLKAWNAPHVKKLIAETPADKILLSNIYERQVQAGKPWFEGCLTGVGDCAHATRPDLGQGGAMAIEDGVELGVYIREAMEAAGKPFQAMGPEQIAAALRSYEVDRSHRVAHIVAKSGMMGNIFMYMGYLPRFVMRFILSMAIQPTRFLEHTLWAPHGKLCPPNLHMNKGIEAEE